MGAGSATAEDTNIDEHPRLLHPDGLTEDKADELAGTFDQAPYEVRLHESAIDVDGGIRYAKELKIHSYRPTSELTE